VAVAISGDKSEAELGLHCECKYFLEKQHSSGCGSLRGRPSFAIIMPLKVAACKSNMGIA